MTMSLDTREACRNIRVAEEGYQRDEWSTRAIERLAGPRDHCGGCGRNAGTKVGQAFFPEDAGLYDGSGSLGYKRCWS